MTSNYFYGGRNHIFPFRQPHSKLFKTYLIDRDAFPTEYKIFMMVTNIRDIHQTCLYGGVIALSTSHHDLAMAFRC